MITIHSKIDCSFCVKAKKFLMEHKLDYIMTEILYDPMSKSYEHEKNTLVKITKCRTFPQIFIGKTFLGGFNELQHAYATLYLHELLGIEPEF